MLSVVLSMKNDRIGDWLWEEWDGEGFEASSDLIYYTNDWVDLSHEIVKRALASCLQRDGIADSLGDGFRMSESGTVYQTYAGYIIDEKLPVICNEFGESDLGDLVEYPMQITLIEF